MYSHFCYLFQQDEMQHRATMHLTHKPGEQIEVDWVEIQRPTLIRIPAKS